MPWFSHPHDPEDIYRLMAESMLRSLAVYLPIQMEPYLGEIHAGKTPERVVRDLGNYLAERLHRQQEQITELESRLSQSERRASRLSQEIESLKEEPFHKNWEFAQERIQLLTERLNQSEDELSAVRQALEAEQWSRQQETDHSDDYIAAQNRIIAQQQLRLNGLLGETPGAETPGER